MNGCGIDCSQSFCKIKVQRPRLDSLPLLGIFDTLVVELEHRTAQVGWGASVLATETFQILVCSCLDLNNASPITAAPQDHFELRKLVVNDSGLFR